MTIDIVVLPGDGIGPEVTAEAVKVLRAVDERYGHSFALDEHLVGGASIDAQGVPVSEETMAACAAADAVLLGAVGGPRWDDPSAPVRPEQALFRLRKELGLFTNLRPVRVYPALCDASPLRPERLADVDLLIVRELTGGLYFGRPQGIYQATDDRRQATDWPPDLPPTAYRLPPGVGRHAVDTMAYSEAEIERVLRVGFASARARRRRLTSVDKANVLATSRLWRQVATRLQADYPDVELEHLLVDSAAMRLITAPGSFDVIVTENTFGDILSDEASVLAGSLGLLPSASLGYGQATGDRRQATEQPTGGPARGLYEPVHGTAPDIAGRGVANPLGAILSAALLLRHSCGLDAEAAAVERAVSAALDDGLRTADLISHQPSAISRQHAVDTSTMGDAIVTRLTAA
jgi:3-isopropylmalate dehydrogenase